MLSAMRTASERPRPSRARDGVAAVGKAVEILERLGDGRTWRVADIAASTGVTRSTAYRILETLEMKGWVRREGPVRRYAIGEALAALGRTRRSSEDLVLAARPLMRRLWEEFGETVNLAVPEGGRVVYVDMIESPQRLRTTSRVGSSDPLYSTALGRAILALHPPAEARRLLHAEDREGRTPRTRVEVGELLDEIDATRERGYAVDDEENEIGSRCVAAGIHDADGRPIAALSVSAPTLRLDDGRIDEVGRALLRAARELQAGFGPPVPVEARSGEHRP